jgi:thiamine biosynthesis protein ThiS
LRLTVNGEVRECGKELTVAGLLAELGVNPKKVAVERNLMIVPKSAYAATLLAEGDQLEIVTFVGGG